MLEHIETLPPPTCRIDFDARGTLIHVDAQANVEVRFDQPMIAVIGDLQALIDRLKRELPGFAFHFDPSRPVPHPGAFMRVIRAAVVAEEKAGTNWTATNEPDLAALAQPARAMKGGA